MRLRALCLLLVLSLAGTLGVGLARAERSQEGNLIVRLDGGVSPLKLPRDRPAPVAVHLDGGLQTADGELLPRVTELELGLPGRGIITTRGLPTCSQQRLTDTTNRQALMVCGDALVGRGRLVAEVVLPNQEPFRVRADLLAFNGRVDGRRAVLMHGIAVKPPTVVVVPFIVSRRSGRFGLALVGNLSPALGPWPRFAHFDLTLSRRFSYRGKSFSYLSASCPIPLSLTAGFFSFASTNFTLDDGNQIGTGITRGCRAR